MVAYIVHVKISESAHERWYDWMIDKHMGDLLNTGCFEDARMYRDEANDGDGRRAYRFVYLAKSQDELQRYTHEFAPELKREHSELFAGEVEAWREILPLVHLES